MTQRISTDCGGSTTMDLSGPALREAAFQHAYSLARFHGASPDEAHTQAEEAARRHDALTHARAL